MKLNRLDMAFVGASQLGRMDIFDGLEVEVSSAKPLDLFNLFGHVYLCTMQFLV